MHYAQFNYRKAMPTPWGKADHKVKLDDGVYWVGTPSHGGFMIGGNVAKRILSLKARVKGQIFGPWLAYEEDCLCSIVFYEHPEYLERIGSTEAKDMTLEEIKSNEANAIKRWIPSYFEEHAPCLVK